MRFPMSSRWSSCVVPKSPKGGLKNARRPISVKIALRLKKVCCENYQQQSCKAFIGLTNCAKMVGEGRPLLPEIFLSISPHWSKITDFRSLFARRDSAVTPSEKSSININRKSTTHFPVRPRWTSYVVPKPPKGGSKMQSVRNLNNKLQYLGNSTR